jgi:hypothetical protein
MQRKAGTRGQGATSNYYSSAFLPARYAKSREDLAIPALELTSCTVDNHIGMQSLVPCLETHLKSMC